MTWTLHRYLARELVRTVLLAVAALTLVMTTFAIIEPLRKEGLSPQQVLRLFWYTLPVMVSLTLPIAALFAATIIYGRFSSENELTACRASGISTFSLMKPGLVMAVVVSLLTLLLNNWVAPGLALRGEEVVKDNLRAILYQQLRSKPSVKFTNTNVKMALHADEVDAVNDELRGVVAIDYRNPQNVSYVVASKAFVQFDKDSGATSITFTVDNPSVGRQTEYSTAEQARQTYELAMPGSLKDSESFYDWHMLREVAADPQKSRTVQEKLNTISRQLYANNLYEEMANALTGGRPYTLSYGGQERYSFEAPSVQVSYGNGMIMLAEDPPNQPPRMVVIRVYNQRDDRLVRTIQCRKAELRARYVAAIHDSQVSVDLTDVYAQRPGESSPLHRLSYLLGPLDMPAGLKATIPADILPRLYNHPEQFPSVSASVKDLRGYIKNELLRRIMAEMHGRVAYGIGCFLMVALGAALGLIFRGGQILSAFGLSCIPGMVLVILIIAGRQMVANPDVGTPMYGLAITWSGVGILLLTLAYVYAFPLRR